MKRVVLIREQDLGLGQREVAYVKKEIEEDGTEFYCYHRNKKLKLELPENEKGNIFRVVKVVKND